MLLFALDRVDSLSNIATHLERRVAEYLATNIHVATSGMLTPRLLRHALDDTSADRILVSANATVLLVGASRGLRNAIAAEYIARGSRVVALMATNALSPTRARETLGELDPSGTIAIMSSGSRRCSVVQDRLGALARGSVQADTHDERPASCSTVGPASRPAGAVVPRGATAPEARRPVRALHDPMESATTQIPASAGPDVRTAGRWLGDPDRPLVGWLTTPAGGPSAAGVLVLPDVGAQYWSAHGTLRALAERLAGAGHTVLRLDYDGTGDAAGDQRDGGRLAAWRASAATGAQELRALGCARLTIMGVRLGAMLALADGAALDADEVVAWAPETSGRRLARALRLLGEPVPGDDGLTNGGVLFSASTLADLGTLDLTGITAAPAPRTLIVGDVGRRAADHLRDLGGTLDVVGAEGSDVALDRATEDAEVARPVVEAIAGWLAPPPPAGPLPPAPERRSARLRWEGHRLSEEIVAIDGLVGVLTEPETVRTDVCTVVFLNAGSCTHVGPGRAWVEYARSLAAAGHRALRVDWRGWGESPDEGHAPGRPYDRHTEQETIGLVRALHAGGHERVVLSGLCASAWMALRVAREAGAAGVVAINPQMYWRWGDPVLSQVDTGIERTDKRLREERGRRLGLWTALDLVGHRPPVGRWLDELAAARLPVLLLFSEGDDGLGFLRNRLARRLERVQRTGAVHVAEIAGIDHGMHRAWLRPQMVRAVLDHLDRIG
ncbi:MAG TPA: hypothetical protein VNT03_00215 [Baekduia sp.]|nr:hypothetical protein [Baekduia sp.]